MMAEQDKIKKDASAKKRDLKAMQNKSHSRDSEDQPQNGPNSARKINGIKALSYNQFLGSIWRKRAEKEHAKLEAVHGHSHNFRANTIKDEDIAAYIENL